MMIVVDIFLILIDLVLLFGFLARVLFLFGVLTLVFFRRLWYNDSWEIVDNLRLLRYYYDRVCIRWNCCCVWIDKSSTYRSLYCLDAVRCGKLTTWTGSCDVWRIGCDLNGPCSWSRWISGWWIDEGDIGEDHAWKWLLGEIEKDKEKNFGHDKKQIVIC